MSFLSDAGLSPVVAVMSREAIVTVTAVLAIAAFWAGIYFWDRRRRPTAPAPGTGLFGDLCRVHQLSREERDVLHRVTTGLPSPAVVFVDPQLLDRLGDSHPADAVACAALRGRLFCE
jgi:hypothetical protein